MGKPQPVRVPSDDCKVVEGAQTFNPHEGEWVEIMPGFRVGDGKTMRGILELKDRLAALDETADDIGLQRIVVTDDAYQALLRALRARVVRWNWTDDFGEPLPQPREDPSIFDQLRMEEAIYLGSVIQQSNPQAEADFTQPSLTTS